MRVTRPAILLAYLCVVDLIESPAPAQSCDCDISESRERAYDELLKLDEAEKEAAEETHFPWGVPENASSATNERMLHQHAYVLNYDEDLKVPTWAGYRLRESDLRHYRVRTECFRKDIRLTDDAASLCEDYEEPVFDGRDPVCAADACFRARVSAMLFRVTRFREILVTHRQGASGDCSRPI